MIVIHATLPVAPGDRERAVELATDLAGASREEDGVLEYRVLADLEDESTIRVLERYADEDGLSAHMGSEHFLSFQQDVLEVLAGEPTLHRYDVAEESRLL